MSKKKILAINPINPDNCLVESISGIEEQERFCVINSSGIKPDIYLISSFGRLFSFETEKEILPYKGKYPKYKFKTTDGMTHTYMINRLVAEAFVPKTKADIKLKRDMIHCRDWNGRNSDYRNLQWVNNTELKILTAIKNGRNDQEYYKIYIKQLLDLDYSQSEICKLLPNIPANNVKGFIKFISTM